MSDDVLNNCFTKPNIHAFPGGADSNQPVSGGTCATDQYAQAKQNYYTNPLLNELHNRLRILEARKRQISVDLDVLYSLIRTLGD